MLERRIAATQLVAVTPLVNPEFRNYLKLPNPTFL